MLHLHLSAPFGLPFSHRLLAVCWESTGRCRIICVCKWQCSIDYIVWEASSFTNGVDQPLQDEMREKRWARIVCGNCWSSRPTKQGMNLIVVPDSCVPRWEAEGAEEVFLRLVWMFCRVPDLRGIWRSPLASLLL